MILTGKCKEAFTIWMKKYPNIKSEQFETMPEWMINALIIDFFDSNNEVNFQDTYMLIFKDYFLMRSIMFIQTEAIKKANEIFNNQ